VKKDTPPFTPKGEYLFRVIKTIQSAGNHNENRIDMGLQAASHGRAHFMAWNGLRLSLDCHSCQRTFGSRLLQRCGKRVRF
jgi:hypothetical protein